MPQQLFPFSFTLGPVSRVEGAFPLSFYSMTGVAGNRFAVVYSPQSNWGGIYDQGMTLADIKGHRQADIQTLVLAGKDKAGAIMHTLMLSDNKKRNGIVHELLLAGHNMVTGILREMSLADRPSSSAQIVDTTYHGVKGKRQSAIFKPDVIMSHPSGRSSLVTQVSAVFSQLTQASMIIDMMIESAGVKDRYGALDMHPFTVLTRKLYLPGHVERNTPTMNRLMRLGHNQDDLPISTSKQPHLGLEEDGLQDTGILQPKVSMISTNITFAVKSASTSLFNREIILASKQELNSLLRSDHIYAQKALMDAARRYDLTLANVVSKVAMSPGIMSAASIEQKGAHLFIGDLAKDINSKARPAWDDFRDMASDIYDEYTQVWGIIPDHDDRRDLMIVPNRDFSYINNLDLLIDANGVPYEPLSDTSTSDVQVRYPVTHPFPQWADVGDQEVWVSLKYLKEGILQLIQTWRSAKIKLAGMTLLEGLNYLLEAYYEYLQEFGDQVQVDQYRVFRLARWFAERQVMYSSAIVLRREYGQWTDQMRQGSMNAQGSYNGFTIMPDTGIIQSTSPYGEIDLSLTNYVDGEFSVSASVPSGTDQTNLVLLIDGEAKRVITTGMTLRMKIPVAAGTHRIQIVWDGQGGSAILSGFVLTGAEFLGATTSFEDPKELQGNMAIHKLIGDLMKYYHDHWDQYKNKGSMGIRQRKPWLTT